MREKTWCGGLPEGGHARRSPVGYGWTASPEPTAAHRVGIQSPLCLETNRDEPLLGDEGVGAVVAHHAARTSPLRSGLLRGIKTHAAGEHVNLLRVSASPPAS